jgi:hypothetical protein
VKKLIEQKKSWRIRRKKKNLMKVSTETETPHYTTKYSTLSGFGLKQLEKFGFKVGDGLGKNRDGSTKLVSQSKKYETKIGLGSDKKETHQNGWWENSYNQVISSIQVSKNYDKNKESMKVLTKIEAKNLKVNFLFWRPDQASFIVLDIINDVYYKDLQEKLQKINEVNYSLSYKKFALNYYFNFNDLYWLLFPNYKSHNSPDPKLYRKELLNLIDSIFKNREIDYNYLINS